MRPNNREVRSFYALAVLAGVLTLTARPSLGQDAGQTSGKDNPPTQDTSKQVDSSASEPTSPIGLAWANSYIHQIGTAGLLAGNREGIGWGSLYLPSASAIGIVDQFGVGGAAPVTAYSAAVLQTTVVYDHRFWNSRLAIQYTPSLAIANGQIVKDFSNQNTTLDFLVYTRPRWNVRFSDTFGYDYSQRVFGFPFFDVNPASGGAVTSSFLNGPSSYLWNSANLSIAYALSVRSSISVTPSFTFSQSGSGATSVHAGSYGGSVNWNYRTSERQSVGISYSGELIHETFPANSSPPSSDTLYHTIAGTIARQLSATAMLNGSLGVSTSSSSQFAQNQRQWYFYGSFGVMKQLKRASLGLQYYRGDTFSSGLISSRFADRVDATYHNDLTKRLGFQVGGGYLRQVETGGFSGWYASSDVRLLLAPRAGLFSFFDFTRSNQSVNTTNLYSGDLNSFLFGIKWQPGGVPH